MPDGIFFAPKIPILANFGWPWNGLTMHLELKYTGPE
jgi:hypothetical protein